MVSSYRQPFLIACAVSAVFATACGGSSHASLSPLAPSSTSAPSASGATISGQVTGPTATSRSFGIADGEVHTMDARGITVSGMGRRQCHSST